MRKNQALRRSSTFKDLFAERQVYLRSGLSSRYVVLSRPLQIGVTIGVGLIVAGLVITSYSSVVDHLETVDLRRELALAEARIGELSATRQADGVVTAGEDAASQDAATDAGPGGDSKLAGRVARAEAETAEPGQGLDAADSESKEQTAQLAEDQSRADEQIEELTRQLETSDAEGNRLQGDLEAALADAALLRQAAETAEANLADLQAEMARLRQQPPADGEAGRNLAEIKTPATAEADEVSALKASLAGAEARIAALSADLEAAKSELYAAREEEPLPTGALARHAAAEAGSGGDELARLRAELRAAKQRIGELEAAIRLGLANLAPPPAPAAPR